MAENHATVGVPPAASSGGTIALIAVRHLSSQSLHALAGLSAPESGYPAHFLIPAADASSAGSKVRSSRAAGMRPRETAENNWS
jgi:hypothetical protein